MAKKAKKVTSKLSKEHREKISASMKLRHAQQRSRAAASRDEVKRMRKKSRSPGGIRVLTRNGNGKDIIQADADEVILAVRAMKEIRKFL
jgi:hypothetical protein